MAQNVPLVQRILASSATVAARAGNIIRDVMSKGELGIVDKGINDLQTEADRSAQCCIIANLSRDYPNITIIGEEGQTDCDIPNDWVVHDSDPEIISKKCPEEYLNVKDEDIVVWVDPLDGTSEYTQGLLDHVTVLIGVSIKGRAVGGIIHQPYYNYKTIPKPTGRTLWGLVGMGYGGFVAADPPSDKLIITTTRSHNDATVTKALNALQPDEIIRVGGAGHKVILVLEGRAHLYLYTRHRTSKWDTCAPEGVLRAIGGDLTGIYGQFYTYEKDVKLSNDKGILATSKSLNHNKIIATLNNAWRKKHF